MKPVNLCNSTSSREIHSRTRDARTRNTHPQLHGLLAAGGMPPISSYRAAVGVVATRVHSYLWIFLLPAAAECTASVWFPSISYGRLDLQLAVQWELLHKVLHIAPCTGALWVCPTPLQSPHPAVGPCCNTMVFVIYMLLICPGDNIGLALRPSL